METASQRASVTASAKRTEEAEPTLIGQLRLLDEEWGEGFREDIAAPLAKIIQVIRGQHAARSRSQERELDEKDDVIDDLEAEVSGLRESAQSYEELRTELEDVPRGVRTIEEVLEKHEVHG